MRNLRSLCWSCWSCCYHEVRFLWLRNRNYNAYFVKPWSTLPFRVFQRLRPFHDQVLSLSPVKDIYVTTQLVRHMSCAGRSLLKCRYLAMRIRFDVSMYWAITHLQVCVCVVVLFFCFLPEQKKKKICNGMYLYENSVSRFCLRLPHMRHFVSE